MIRSMTTSQVTASSSLEALAAAADSVGRTILRARVAATQAPRLLRQQYPQAKRYRRRADLLGDREILDRHSERIDDNDLSLLLT